jgi:hypothetical protein
MTRSETLDLQRKLADLGHYTGPIAGIAGAANTNIQFTGRNLVEYLSGVSVQEIV